MHYVFFDIGSTLVDERKAYDERTRAMIAESGISFEQFTAKRIFFSQKGLDGESEAVRFFNLTKTPWPSEYERLFPDAEKTLSYLKGKGYKLGIIANQLSGAKVRLKDFGILEYFETFAISSELGIQKPDERIFLWALKAFGCTAQDAVMIGDRIDNDIIPAKRIGMKTVWINRNPNMTKMDSGLLDIADHVVYSLDGLRDLL